MSTTQQHYFVTPKNGSSSSSITMDRPIFVLQPGPTFAGTPELMNTLVQYEGLLRNDSYFVEPPRGGVFRPLTGTYCRKHVSCCAGKCEMDSFNISSLYEIQCMQDLQNNLDIAQQRNHNIIVLSELMGFVQANYDGKARCPTHWSILKHVLRNWQVEVVIGYRRYFEWLVSLKVACDMPQKYKNYDKWPSVGGTQIMPIWDHISGVLHGNVSFGAPFTTDMVRDFGQHFNVSVWNVHQPHDDNDLVKSFVCNQLPNANIACRREVTTNFTEPQVPQVNQEHFHDLIAVEAYSQGLLNISLSRTHVRRMILERQQIQLGLTPLDFPLVCPDNHELHQLLATSLQKELEVLPEFYATPDGKDSHVDAFWAFVNEKVFCTVNVTAVLSQPDWQRFLLSL